MIGALGTLAFLASLWLLVAVGAAVLEESGAKIAAALKGELVRPPSPYVPRTHMRQRPVSAMRAAARWRAAA
jgi:hypothetical protein